MVRHCAVARIRFCYSVSKLISGGSLKEKLEQQMLNIMEATAMLAVIAEAADYAHRQGFVHRDLKLANILLDEKLQPYTCDFGLALHEDEQLYRRRKVSGSPAHMSPRAGAR